MAVSLYRKYRPQTFSEMTGQRTQISLIVSALRAGTLAHAYMFSGPRGCGKTTAARILAKAINCEDLGENGDPCGKCESCLAVAAGRHLDLVEIDAASNRSIDDIKSLQENVSLLPLMGRMKLYILDEVHMLTREAFNALLKTLEEPPETAMFILATTDPQKVPVTIRSRCQHIPFHRISPEDITSRLREVASMEGLSADDAALGEIARAADGGLRDALTLAEQAVALGGGLTDAAVSSIMGGSSRGDLERVFRAFREDPAAASEMLHTSLEHGADPERIVDGLFVVARDIWEYVMWGDRTFGKGRFTDAEVRFISDEAPHWDADAVRRVAHALARTFQRARYGLKTDVFAGLLIFGVMSAIDGGDGLDVQPAPSSPFHAPARSPATPRPDIRRNRSDADDPFLNRPRPVIGEQRQPIQPEKRLPPDTPIVSAEPTRPAFVETAAERAAWVSSDACPLPPEFESLPIHIAAAMLWSSGLDEAGMPMIDAASAPKIAVDILRSPRAKAIFSGGVTSAPAVQDRPVPPRVPAESVQPVRSPVEVDAVLSDTADRPPPPQISGEITPDRIAAILGADLLMFRSADHSDDDTDDREDDDI